MVAGPQEVLGVITSFSFPLSCLCFNPKQECSLIPISPSSHLLTTTAHSQGALGRGSSKDNPIDVEGTLFKESNKQALQGPLLQHIVLRRQ